MAGQAFPSYIHSVWTQIFSPPSSLLLAHVSRDGRDLAIMSATSDIFLIRDFERVCRGETSLEASGPNLHLPGQTECYYLAFEHGHVCVATVRTSDFALARTHVLS